MKRRHLPELEDETWFPAFLRDYGTDYLQFMINAGDAYKNLVPYLQKGLAKAKKKVVVDLAAGGGGGWLKLGKRLKAAEPDVKVVLTDYFPNQGAFQHLQEQDPDLFEYRKESVNALDVPKDLVGLRTQFLSFHHFRPAEAQKILQNAVDCNSPIMVVEVTERSVKQVIQFAISPLLVLFVMPFVRPFKIGRIIFTYLIPILPFFIAWDGIASAFRTYKPEEIEAMTKSLKNADSFTWEIGWHESKPSKVLVVLGVPKN
jgi:hypothetical protein